MVYFLTAAGVFFLDLAVKRYVDRRYGLKVRHPHFKDKIIVEKYYNKGAALNFLACRPKLMRALHTAILALVGAAYSVMLRKPGKRLGKAGMSLLLGGGLSNLYDRYRNGHVVDYFRINVGPRRLRRIIFNISDFCIFIGALLAVIGSEGEGK